MYNLLYHGNNGTFRDKCEKSDVFKSLLKLYRHDFRKGLVEVRGLNINGCQVSSIRTGRNGDDYTFVTVLYGGNVKDRFEIQGRVSDVLDYFEGRN